MSGSNDGQPVFIVTMSQDDFDDFCFAAASIASQGTMPLPHVDVGQKLLHLSHLAYDRVIHPKRKHPCAHCETGRQYAPPPKVSDPDL